MIVPRCCSSVAKSFPTFWDPMDFSTPGSSVLHHLLELAQIQSIESVVFSNHLILYFPILLLASIFPSIRVFFKESVLHIMWPRYWSFSFSISPSNEYSGLISFWIDWFDLLAVQGTLVFLKMQFKSISSLTCSLLYGPTLISVRNYWKNQ